MEVRRIFKRIKEIIKRIEIDIIVGVTKTVRTKRMLMLKEDKKIKENLTIPIQDFTIILLKNIKEEIKEEKNLMEIMGNIKNLTFKIPKKKEEI